MTLSLFHCVTFSVLKSAFFPKFAPQPKAPLKGELAAATPLTEGFFSWLLRV